MLSPRYRDLILYKTYADLRAESERTYLGYVWWILDPLFNMVVFWLVFSVFLQRAQPNYPAFLLVGLTSWRWFDVSVKAGAQSIRANGALMRQVYLSKLLFPVISVLGNTFKFLVSLVVLLVFLWLYGIGAAPSYLALPVLLGIELLLILGLTLPLAAAVPFVPDLVKLVENLLRLMFFLSGIFYAGSSLPESIQRYFYLNPMAALIETFRQVLLERTWPDWQLTVPALVVALIGIIVGSLVIIRNDRAYPRMGAK